MERMDGQVDRWDGRNGTGYSSSASVVFTKAHMCVLLTSLSPPLRITYVYVSVLYSQRRRNRKEKQTNKQINKIARKQTPRSPKRLTLGYWRCAHAIDNRHARPIIPNARVASLPSLLHITQAPRAPLPFPIFLQRERFVGG